jgi:hypothetical protein
MPVLSSTTPDQIGEVVKFLSDSYGTRVDDSLARWKYFERESRSYVLRRDGRIAAHACVWPCANIPASRVIDWAVEGNDGRIAGEMLRCLAETVGPLIAIGSSRQTRQMIATVPFRDIGRLDFYGGVVRPMEHYRTGPTKGWKAPVKMARNVLRNRLALKPVPQGWSVRPADEAMSRDLLSCPVGSFSSHEVVYGGKPAGRFVLNRALGQTRVVDVQGDAPQLWAAAVRTAAELPETCELVAGTSVEAGRSALRSAGLRLHHGEAIYLHDPQNRIPHLGRLHMTMADGDEAWFVDAACPYLW